MNILVTGANGQLGTCIKHVVDTFGNGEKDHYVGDKNRYIFKGREDLDIGNYEQVLKTVKEEYINVIVNCAAYTNVNRAQEEQELAYLVNAKCAQNLANAAKSVGAVLIHISTDYVFSVRNKTNTPLLPVKFNYTNEPYIWACGDENFYGYSKLEGERLIAESGCKYIILRTSWLYSWFGNNFVKTMFKMLSNNQDIKVVYDQVGSPTSAHELALFIYHIIEHHNHETRYLCKEGIYNFVENGVASWYDIVQGIKACMDEYYSTNCLAGGGKITPCLTNEFSQPVERPHYSVLDNSKTKECFDYNFKYWRDSLKYVVNCLCDKHVEEIEKH